MGAVLGSQEKREVAFDRARLCRLLWDVGELLTFRDSNIIIRFDSVTHPHHNMSQICGTYYTLSSHTSLPDYYLSEPRSSKTGHQGTVKGLDSTLATKCTVQGFPMCSHSITNSPRSNSLSGDFEVDLPSSQIRAVRAYEGSDEERVKLVQRMVGTWVRCADDAIQRSMQCRSILKVTQ
jgi:hypothetical protein